MEMEEMESLNSLIIYPSHPVVVSSSLGMVILTIFLMPRP